MPRIPAAARPPANGPGVAGGPAPRAPPPGRPRAAPPAGPRREGVACARSAGTQDGAVSEPSDTPRARAQAFLAGCAAEVEEALGRWLPAPPDGAPRLAEAMRYSLAAGGKRLRPALALATSRCLGGADERVLPFACALELVHTYSLIHDDLPAMDDDDLRRGRPTSHKVFGEALAILAGDALHSAAFQILLTHTPDAGLARDLGRELAEAAGHAGMVGGQVEDLTLDRRTADLERLERMHRAKTGALLLAAVRGGALAAHAPEPIRTALEAYGRSLGLAFQIADDLLDETGTPEQLGKTPGKDRAHEKLTYVSLEGLAGARARLLIERDRALGALAPVPGSGLLADLVRFVAAREA